MLNQEIVTDFTIKISNFAMIFWKQYYASGVIRMAGLNPNIITKIHLQKLMFMANKLLIFWQLAVQISVM